MVKNRDFVIAVLFAFCLAAMLFLVKPIRSQTNPPYNPMFDLNDDGIINMHDITLLARDFGTSGTPINKTQLLLQQDEIDYLNSTVVSLQASLAQMNSTINQLSNSVDILNMTKLGKPDADSGWLNITAGQQLIFNHNLGTTNVLVYMIGNDTSGTLYIHQIKYGMDDNLGYEYGARWQELTPTSIKVIRGISDPNWNQIRIMIWKIPT